jgi:hypothetical protein
VFVGNLIFPNVAVIRQLDTVATRAAGDYDDDFREFVLVDSDNDGIGEPQRHESPELKLLAQFATRRMDFADQGYHGEVPDSRDLEMTFHFKDLTAKGLVASDGRAKINPGDRLVRIEDRAGNVLHTFTDPPGMYVIAARPSGFMGRARNLLVCTLSDRRQDTMAPIPEKRQN